MIIVKTYAIGDIHGRYEPLRALLTETKFDMDKDRLITLGDICDGGRKTRQCYDLLMQVKNRVDVIGNHDLWFLDWIRMGDEKPLWTLQGGYNTMESYDFNRNNVPRAHIEFIEKSHPYFIDEKNRIYVHGGFNPKIPIENQKLEFLIWDRTLIKYAQHHKIPKYKHVFIGHTSTQLLYNDVTTPLTFNNLTMCDCGGGWSGRLGMVNADNPETDFCVSELQVPQTYDNYEPPETEEFAWGVELKNPLKNPNW
jgi:serine/threonine protein phosphatase 1